jgi:hypothetical protein
MLFTEIIAFDTKNHTLCGYNAVLLSVAIGGIIRIVNEPGNSVRIVSGYGLGDRAVDVRSPAEAKGFFL